MAASQNNPDNPNGKKGSFYTLYKGRPLAAKALAADLLMAAFLVLTLYHSQHVLAQFENSEVRDWGLSWALAGGLDLGIAYAAFVIFDNSLNRGTRVAAAVWLGGLLVVSYGLNVAYYNDQKSSLWSWGLALVFPGSLAFLGAIKPGLSATVLHPTTSLGELASATAIASRGAGLSLAETGAMPGPVQVSNSNPSGPAQAAPVVATSTPDLSLPHQRATPAEIVIDTLPPLPASPTASSTPAPLLGALPTPPGAADGGEVSGEADFFGTSAFAGFETEGERLPVVTHHFSA